MRPSDNKQGLSWIASLGFAALGIAASLLAYAVLSSTTNPRFWVVARETFALPAQIVSIAYFCWAALSEEIAKALGALSARLTSSRLSWWTIAAFVGAAFGLIERVLLMMSWTPEFLAQVPPAVGTALNISAVFSHAALCVCLSPSRLRLAEAGAAGCSALSRRARFTLRTTYSRASSTSAGHTLGPPSPP
ncbi:MAG: hypothetical protein K2P70_02595 [Hyphomonadaceae bacterium]|nr:hypothetical protein [Hyphomonadaceae bacterium]